MRPRRVLLIDDLVVESDALGLQLSTVAGLVLVGRYRPSDPDLLRELSGLRPDVTVVDLPQAGAAAEGLVHALRGVRSTARVLVLSDSDDAAFAVRAALAGCDAWIDKRGSLDFLVRAVQGVCDGQAWWPPKLLGAVLRGLRASADQRTATAQSLASLTLRERDILDAIRAGDSQHEIADRLSIAVNTVRTHTSNVFAKLGVHSRSEAVALAESAQAAGTFGAAAAGEPSPSGDVVELINGDDPAPACGS